MKESEVINIQIFKKKTPCKLFLLIMSYIQILKKLFKRLAIIRGLIP